MLLEKVFLKGNSSHEDLGQVHEKNLNLMLGVSIYPLESCVKLAWTVVGCGKGQLISKANCQAVNSSKKRTNEFVFTKE